MRQTQQQQFFLYARKSSESEDRQIQSIDDQITRLRERAVIEGISIKEIFIEAKSAKKPNNRPIYEDMVRRIKAGEASGILCWEFNRLSRNPVDSGELIWLLQQGVITCIETIGKKYLPEDNVLLLNIESGMANQFIIDLRRNCRRGMESKAQKGWKPAMAPLGYMNDKLTRTIVPDPKRFPLVKKMWQMLLSEMHTAAQILAIATNDLGLRTPKYTQSGNKEITLGGLYKLFNNIFYTGQFSWANTIYNGKHAQMISLGEFDKAQVILGRKGKPRPQKHHFAYTGLISCYQCTSMVTASDKRKLLRSTGKYTSYKYYHCTRKKRASIKCTSKPITLTDLESQIDGELEKYTIAPEFLSWAIDIIEKEAGQTEKDLHTINATRQKSLEVAETELQNLTRMRYKELIDDDTFINEKDILSHRILRLKKSINDNVQDGDKLKSLTKEAFVFATYAREKFNNGSLEHKRIIMHGLGSNYRLNNKKLLYTPSLWLIPIAKQYPELIAEFRRIELQKDIETKERNKCLDKLIQQWCTIVQDVRTVIKKSNNTINIPSLEIKEDI